MVENQFTSTIDTLLRSMGQFASTKTVVGGPVWVGDTITTPLIDATCSTAVGSFAEGVKQKHRGGGGMSARMSPSTVLVIQGGVTKLANIENQDAITRAIDMASSFINKLLGEEPAASEEMVWTARDTAAVYGAGEVEHTDVRQESRAVLLHMTEYSLLQNGGDN